MEERRVDMEKVNVENSQSEELVYVDIESKLIIFWNSDLKFTQMVHENIPL